MRRTRGRRLNRRSNPNAFRGRKLSPELVRRVVDAYLSMEQPSYKGALLAAGYAESTASKEGYKFFKRPAVKAYLKERQKEFSDKSGVTREDLIARLKMIAFNDLSKFMKAQEDGTLVWNFKGATQKELSLINELSVESYVQGRGEIKVPVKKFRISTRDSLRAIELLGRLTGSFQDKLALHDETGVVERLQSARKVTRGNTSE